MKKLIYLFASLALMAVACNDNSDSGEENDFGDIPFTEYPLEGTPGEEYSASWVNLDYDEKNYESKILVINSSEELKKYVEGDYPPVDFSKKTLLLAIGTAPNKLSNKIIQSLQQLSAGKYKWSIEIKLGTADIMQDWTVAILTDKLSAESKVELNVTYIY
ncbi:MAG: hypothetical protein LBV32_04815 [Tannerellaceae bacterium]|jgi:hypothetical protein|nr:hypothetical protein [Tannerellaceae bacterium]